MKGLKIIAEPDDEDAIQIGVIKPTKQEKKEKKLKEIFTETNFTSPPIEQASPMGGGRGGGRGGARGGGAPRGGGGGRGRGSAPAANINLADDSSFPTL